MRTLHTTDEERRQVIARHPYFQGIEPGIAESLAQALTLRIYEAGEALFWEREPSAGLFMLIRGAVKLFRLSPQGREVIIRLAKAGETFNEVSVFDQGNNPVNVMAIEECHVWHLSTADFQAALQQSPRMMYNAIQTLCRRARHLVQMVEELSLYRVTCRLARLIAHLKPEELHGHQRLTQDELAARLGTVREVVARALRELQQMGAIRLQHGRIYVENPGLLRECAMLPEKR